MSQLQRHLVQVTLNGVSCDSCVKLELVSSNYRQAGTFTLHLAFAQESDANARFWQLLLGTNPTGQELLINISLGVCDVPTGNTIWRSMMLGLVDHIAMDVQNNMVELEGRDLAARLMSLPTEQNFLNQTSSEIVSGLAAVAGFNANVETTNTAVGQFYQIDHSRSSLATFSRFSNAFDVINYLAQVEGFDFWVAGYVLNFVAFSPPPSASLIIDVPNLTSNLGVVTNIKRLRLDRRVMFDGGAQVTVKSWNSRQRTTIEKSFPTSAANNGNIVFLSPNLSDGTALAKAEALYSDLIRHKRVVSCEMTGDVNLMPRDLLQVVGSQGWDGSYVVDEVIRQISPRSGFTQSVVAHAL